MKTCVSNKLFQVTVVCALLLWTFYAFTGSKAGPGPPVALSHEEYRLHSPHTYTYVFNQPHACHNRSQILVVFLVPAAPHHYAQREAVRKTWGASGESLRTLTLFFLGSPEDSPQKSEIQRKVDAESRKYGDIVQMDFLDTYQNLTIKTLQMLRWLDAHCPQAQFGMKVDADIFVNVFYLRDYLSSCPRRNFITGSVINDGKPKRDSNNKWMVSKQQYPEDTFPPYVSGAGYVFSRDVAGQVSGASRFVRLVSLEDVYVGLCLRFLDIQPRYAYSLLPWPRDLFDVRSLKYERCRFAKLILVNGFRPSELTAAWEDFEQGFREC